MSRKSIIQEYWDLEDQLTAIAKAGAISLEHLISNLASFHHETILMVRPLLQRQVELLHQMRMWQLEGAKNVSLLPVSSLRSA